MRNTTKTTVFLTAAILCGTSGIVHAASGSPVTVLESNNASNPECIMFQTLNDAQWYGTSLNDPGFAQALVTLNNARGYSPGINFVIGDPGAPFHAADCANGVVYVHDIRR